MDTIFEKMGLFYLGKNSDDDTLELYESKHLTTHAAIIGMTGSGKTGLGIGIIEEAAIDNIPSLMIDPKGDMGNLCLDFPNMQASDFKPYIDPIAAQNKNLSIDEMAQKTATMWKEGIESFGQDLSRVTKLETVPKTIYTPESSAIRKGKGILKEKNDVKNIQLLIDNMNEDMKQLEYDLNDEIKKIEETFNISNYEIGYLAIKPRRSDVSVKDIAILWER